MKTLPYLPFLALLLTGCATLPSEAPVYGPTNPSPAKFSAMPVKHYCSMVELRPEKETEYRRLHANVWPEVLAAIRKSKIRNFNIYAVTLRNHRYLVCTFDYIGNDPKTDFAEMGRDPTTRYKWWPITNACQIVLPATAPGQQWLQLEQLMHVD
jgi:L-rhamnose mutarotase